MIDQPSFAYNSFIKNIYLEIPGGYQYRHHSSSSDLAAEHDAPFLGREEILESFVNILRKGSSRGAYLVTGYRGMGKTSFVNKTLQTYRSKAKADRRLDKAIKKAWWHNKEINPDRDIVDIRLSLAQSELKDIDILKHIVNQLIASVDKQRDYQFVRWFSISNVFGWLWPLITVILLLMNYSLPTSKDDGQVKTIIENLLGIVSLSALLTLFVYKSISWLHEKIFQNKPAGRLIIISLLGFYLILFIGLFYKARFIFIATRIEETITVFVIVTIFTVVCIKLVNLLFHRSHFTIKQIYERLKVLHNRCNAQMTSEDQFRETFSASISSLFKKDVLIYPIANPKEIEAELISIISELKPYIECIFVFDELDKVDPGFEHAVFIDSEGNEKRTYLNDLRERRHVITHILGSLKYFINGADAKFIFIAGREMFEAALADISDRQSSISSIFHQVIYVDSFLKDKSGNETRSSSIGVLVERHLTTLLLPTQYKRHNSDFFSDYYAFLIRHLTPDFRNSQPQQVQRIEQEARKTVFVLQNFLGYLVYRSNGSPKKIIKLLEEYIVSYEIVQLKQNIEKDIIFTTNKFASHYLRFSYIDQYKLGFTAYLFQPFLTMYSSFMKRYSDSTLVSTPYLIDNLIKFHPFAFSAQNLELIPEILSTNKSPISRPFLEELITFLGQNHIRRTESGLFEYKFYDRTHNEITFISKLFEEEAAAFNFTLDENFSIKAHLIAKIRQLRDSHRSMGERDLRTENPFGSIIFLNRLLGDVRFQDEEYEDAIISYQDAIQMLYYDRLQYANSFVTFIRLKLKLGLTYEKIKAYEFSLGHYAGVIEEGGKYLIENADKHSVIYREFLLLIMQAYSATLYLQEKLQEGITFQKIRHVVQGFEKIMELFSVDYDNRDILRATFYSNVGTALYYKNMVLPQKVNEARVKSRQSVFHSGRKLAQEKMLTCFPDTIEEEFIIASEKEIQSIGDMKHIHEDARLSFTTYVYYKRTLQALLGYEGNDLIGCFQACTILIYVDNTREEATYRSLQHVRRLVSIGQALAKLGDFLLPTVVTRVQSKQSTKQENCVDVTEALGYFYKNNKEAPKESDARTKLLAEYFKKEASHDLKGRVHPRLIVHIYYLASLFYQNASETANAAFQLRKILFLLRSINLTPPNQSITVFAALSCLEENLLKRILELSSWMSHSSDRPQLSKNKRYFGIDTLRTPHNVSSELYGNLSNNPDTKETVLAYALLRMKYAPYLTKASLWDSFRQFPEHKLLSPYVSIVHHIIRIMEHQLHTTINYKLKKTYIEDKLSSIIQDVYEAKPGQQIDTMPVFSIAKGEKNWEEHYFHACKLYDIVRCDWQKSDDRLKADERGFKDILKQLDLVYNYPKDDYTPPDKLSAWVKEYSELVVNSIFNLCQIDRIINTYGINYILSYSFLGRVHHYLGTWVKSLHLCRILNNRYQLGIDIDATLENLVGPQLTTTLDSLTSYQVAIQYYYQAIQLHKEGYPYRQQINNMIYLEDDYNDNLYHFGASIERLRINSGAIRRNIVMLKKELEEANMYKYSTYIGDEQIRKYPVEH